MIRNGSCSKHAHTFVWFVGCLDVLTMAQQANLTVVEETKEKQATSKVYTKDDFTMVNRFESEYIKSESFMYKKRTDYIT